MRTDAQTYTIGATHDSFGTEGQRTLIASKADAIKAAKHIAAQAGHGWRPYVFDAHSNPVDITR